MSQILSEKTTIKQEIITLEGRTDSYSRNVGFKATNVA
jgi:hypothetical protein